MPDASLVGIPVKPTRAQPVPGPAAFKVLYDGQCEICQACVSWLKTLGDGTQTICLPISEEVLFSLNSRLRMDDCLRVCVWLLCLLACPIVISLFCLCQFISLFSLLLVYIYFYLHIYYTYAI